MPEPIYQSTKTFDGIPCSNCGGTLRYISNKNCYKCAKARRKKYLQSPKGKATRKNYYLSPTYKASRKLYHQTNGKEIRQETVHRYKNSSKGKFTYDRWLRSQARKEYLKSSKGKSVKAVAAQKRRALIKNIEGFYTTQEWLDLKEQYGNRCLCCGRLGSELDKPLEQDHIIPVSKGGSNWITNIQPLCHTCNDMGHKGTKIIDYRRILFKKNNSSGNAISIVDGSGVSLSVTLVNVASP
jgi:5-methylcytosine-specific restriction endonuclease McrA